MEIRPSSELRNNYTHISNLAKKTNNPVFLTKNGHGDMVLMSIELFKDISQQNEMHEMLRKSVDEYEMTPKENLVDSDTVFKNMKDIINGKMINV